MKLRNKKTGEIGYLIAGKGSDYYIVANDNWESYGEYDSLADLNEEWEDYEEPKEIYYLSWDGVVLSSADKTGWQDAKQIGNYFETEEEAKKAVEKLKAWKRLKDKGLRFDGYTMFKRCAIDDYEYSPNIAFSVPELDKDEPCGYPCDVIKDLTLLFGGEE